MKKIILAILLFASCAANAQPAHADEVIREACKLAAKENKNVFIIFHASWCGWCHKMDASLNDPVCKEYFDNNYIIRHLVVNESKDKKKLENPGAEAVKIRYNGEGQGIPFWLIFDKDGNLLFDSIIRVNNEGQDKSENAGCPATEKEVNFFVDVLSKTSKLELAQLEKIRQRFRKND